jgi:hypothetical protein
VGQSNNLYPRHIPILGNNCNNFKHTSYKYQYFGVQGCRSQSLYMSNVFPLQDASLELNFRDPLQHRLPFNLNSHNFHIWEEEDVSRG